MLRDVDRRVAFARLPHEERARARDGAMSLSQILWSAGGGAAHADVGEPSRCYVCGALSGTTVPLRRGLAGTFTAHDQCHGSGDRVCAACVWVMSGRSSKERHTWRLYSVLWREDGNVPDIMHPRAPHAPGAWCGNRKDLRPLVWTLLRPPECEWACSFAESSKLQCIPFCPINEQSAAPRVLFERDIVDVADAPRLVGPIARLRALGVSPAEICGGVTPRTAARVGTGVRRCFDELRPVSGSRIVALLAWAINKKHAEEFA